MLQILEGLGATVDQPGIPVLDVEALKAYRQALDDARAELDEARSWNDHGRVASLDETIDALVGQLAAVTASGRVREDSSTRERARKAVSKCIREAIDKIEPAEPALADHLRRSVRTGYECVYDPPRA